MDQRQHIDARDQKSDKFMWKSEKNRFRQTRSKFDASLNVAALSSLYFSTFSSKFFLFFFSSKVRVAPFHFDVTIVDSGVKISFQLMDEFH